MALSKLFFPLRWIDRHLANALSTVLFIGWCIGQLLLDRTWLSGLLFYIPSPVVLACLASVAVWNRRAQSPRLSWTAAIGLLPVVFVVLFVENRFGPSRIDTVHPPIAGASELTMVHWNVASGRLGWRRIRDKLDSQQADVYVLSEQPWNADMIHKWQSDLERTHSGVKFSAAWFNKMVVVAKGEIRDERWLTQTSESQIFSFVWRHHDTSIRVFGVDLTSDLATHRDPLLKHLNALIREHQPDIVMGDFNAPRRSSQLRHLPPGYRHAYNVAGHELGYTWPVPAPVYALDQCIVGPKLQVLRYDLQTSFSDHRLQRLEFREESSGHGKK